MWDTTQKQIPHELMCRPRDLFVTNVFAWHLGIPLVTNTISGEDFKAHVAHWRESVGCTILAHDMPTYDGARHEESQLEGAQGASGSFRVRMSNLVTDVIRLPCIADSLTIHNRFLTGGSSP